MKIQLKFDESHKPDNMGLVQTFDNRDQLSAWLIEHKEILPNAQIIQEGNQLIFGEETDPRFGVISEVEDSVAEIPAPAPAPKVGKVARARKADKAEKVAETLPPPPPPVVEPPVKEPVKTPAKATKPKKK